MSHHQAADGLSKAAHHQTVLQDMPASEEHRKVRRSRKRPQPDEAAAAAARSLVALLAEPLVPSAATGSEQSGGTEKKMKASQQTTAAGQQVAADTAGPSALHTLELNGAAPALERAAVAPVTSHGILADPGVIAVRYTEAVTAFMQLPVCHQFILVKHLAALLPQIPLQHSAGLGSATAQLFAGLGSMAGTAGAAGAHMPAQPQAGGVTQLPKTAPGDPAHRQSGGTNAQNPSLHQNEPAQHSSAQAAISRAFVPAASTGAAAVPDLKRSTNTAVMGNATRADGQQLSRGPAAAASGGNTQQPGMSHSHQARSVAGAGLAQAVAQTSTEELSHLLRGSDLAVLRSVGRRLNCDDKHAYMLAGHMYHALMFHPSLARSTKEHKMAAILWVAMKNTGNRSKFTAASVHRTKAAAEALDLHPSDLQRLESLVLAAIDWRPYKTWPVVLLPAAEGELD